MKSFIVNTTNQSLSLHVNLYDSGSNQLVIFIDGDGAVRDFDQIAQRFSEANTAYDYLTFAFRGVLEGQKTTYGDFIKDFQELLGYIESSFSYKNVILVSTSSGATAATIALEHPSLPISKAIYLDPADFYISDDNQITFDDTWNGNTPYLPTQPTGARDCKR